MCKVILKSTENYDSMTVYSSIKEIMLQQRINTMVKQGSKVLLKPNMLSKSNPNKCVTTHPEILNAVITVLKEFGVNAKDMLIADSSGGPSSSAILQSNYNACGFSVVAKNHGVTLYTKLESEIVKTTDCLVKEFEVIKPAVEFDFIINLAKFKTHVMTGMSGAVKNMFGVVPGLKKAEFHMRFPDKENFANMIVDLCQTVTPNFTIIDAVMGMEGDGPAGGIPRKIGMIMAGTNPYYIDYAICNMMGLQHKAVPIMNDAINRNLCPEILDDSFIIGDTYLYKKLDNFVLPKSYSIDFSTHVPRAIRWATPTIEKIIAPRPKIIKKDCIGCEKCKDICPKHVISMKKGKADINLSGCIKCFCCHEMCPVKAIEVKRSMFFNI